MRLPQGADSVLKSKPDEEEKAEDVVDYPEDGS